MSHLATVQTQFKDPGTLERVCQQLGFPYQRQATVTLTGAVSRPTVTGQVVHPTGWKYPLIVTADGQAHFDDFVYQCPQVWGTPTHFDRLRQRYATQVALAELRRQGHRVIEQTTPTGDVLLVAQVD